MTYHKPTASLIYSRSIGYSWLAGIAACIVMLVYGAVQVRSATDALYRVQIGPLALVDIRTQHADGVTSVQMQTGDGWLSYALFLTGVGLVLGWWLHRRSSAIQHGHETIE